MLDYWLFYPYDLWTTHTAVGTLTQQHGGDWEHVVVGIDGAREPLFVAYSAHACGSWRPWREAPVVRILDGGRSVAVGHATRDSQASHPLVIVARGSHANYPTTGSRETNPAGCDAGWAAGLRPLAFAAGANESTPEFGPIEVPDAAPLDEAAAVLGAPWRWGEREDFVDSGFPVVARRPGPDGPGLQGYGRPASILERWECDADGPKCDQVRAAAAAPR